MGWAGHRPECDHTLQNCLLFCCSSGNYTESNISGFGKQGFSRYYRDETAIFLLIWQECSTQSPRALPNLVVPHALVQSPRNLWKEGGRSVNTPSRYTLILSPLVLCPQTVTSPARPAHPPGPVWPVRKVFWSTTTGTVCLTSNALPLSTGTERLQDASPAMPSASTARGLPRTSVTPA